MVRGIIYFWKWYSSMYICTYLCIYMYICIHLWPLLHWIYSRSDSMIAKACFHDYWTILKKNPLILGCLVFSATDDSYKLVQLTKWYDLISEIPSGCSDFVVFCYTLFGFSRVTIILKITFFLLSHSYSFNTACQNH